MKKFIYYAGIISCIGLIISCFLPWVHYNIINETFTGFYVKRFPNGTFYGKAGYFICVMSGLCLAAMLISNVVIKRVNNFLAAFLLAYVIRTAYVFSKSLFEGDLETKPAIYLIVFFAFVILIATIFPEYSLRHLDRPKPAHIATGRD